MCRAGYIDQVIESLIDTRQQGVPQDHALAAVYRALEMADAEFRRVWPATFAEALQASQEDRDQKEAQWDGQRY